MYDMNKKIAISAGIAIAVVAIAIVGVKTIAGDKATEIPGEEHMENALNIQESNTTSNTNTEPSESGTTESNEVGP